METERALLLTVISLLAAPVLSQDPVGGEVGRQLQELKKRNDLLEARVTSLEAQTHGADDPGSGLLSRYRDITATFQVFGDVGLTYHNPEDANRGHSQFFLGSVDFFANVQMGDRFRILSETVLDARGGENIAADQERLWAMWTVSDGLYVKFGTEHSPVSRWNQLYHHGHWLETSISRPLLANFEGEDGILPMHATGLEFGGRQQVSAGGIEYFLAIANGRGLQPNNKQRTTDRNDSKKIDVGLAFLPSAIPDLRLGTAFSYDEIPADPTAPIVGRALSTREMLATAHGQYRIGPFDVLGEYAWIEHESRQLDTTFHHHAYYLQIAWRTGPLTPYARIDQRVMELADPFYATLNRDLDTLRPVVGVRYDPSDSLAAKLEVAWSRGDERSGGAIGERDVLGVALQVSWVL